MGIFITGLKRNYSRNEADITDELELEFTSQIIN